MGARRGIDVVDSHTEGMPTRVVIGGVDPIPGQSMMERRTYFIENMDDLRTMLMYEPRGHSAMSGAILQPPTRSDADWGVLFIEVSGCLPMCGHGTIGVATVLVDRGLVEVSEPMTLSRLDTPAGLVTAEVKVSAGRAVEVTIRNVPSFVHKLDMTVLVPDLGEVTVDLAYGGNFYAILQSSELGVPFDRSAKDEILRRSLLLMDAINAQDLPRHPTEPQISGCHHVQVVAPGSDAKHSRHAMAIFPGWFDRSPCGTGTSARMAQLHARGELELGEEFLNESFIGTTFRGTLHGETDVGGIPAVLPSITGRAWVTGTAQYFVEDTDPFPSGFLL